MAQLEEIEDEEAPSKVIARQKADAAEADAFAAAPPRAATMRAGEGKGFFENLVASVFEPGVNRSLFQAMNISFILLIICLFVLSFLTNWNKHVLFLMVVSMGLWASMVWFVMEISKVQHSSQNAPPGGSTSGKPKSNPFDMEEDSSGLGVGVGGTGIGRSDGFDDGDEMEKKER